MIRQPSTAAQLYSWWKAALSDPTLPRSDGLPECGWYRTRLVRGGPWVPVRIFIIRDIDPDSGELTGPERYGCECDGESRSAERLWTYLTPISKAEFDRLTQLRTSIPAMAATMTRIDLSLEPVRP